MAERIGIIGGGIVGIALARVLAQRGVGDVVVIEKEGRVAAHQTGHNSGVVHAGIYYAPGSLKARLCAQGRLAMRDYCLDKGLPYREVGKLVVAVDDSERPALDELERRATANRVPGLARVDAAGIREIEPHGAGVAALHSPHTAVVDYSAITRAMADDVVAAGGRIILDTAVTGVRIESGRVRLETTRGDQLFDRVIACAGLQSDLVARMTGADPSPKILPFRGEYWQLDHSRTHLVSGMIYPVPDPSFPFLGVHFTRAVNDSVHVGPNAVPALAREGYSWGRISVRDTWDSLVWPGSRTLVRKYWRMGADEIAASLIKSRYFRKAQMFVPELELRDLTRKEGAGVRAQALGRDGSLIDDFAVDSHGPVTILRNAPSPAATSSMAIAEHLIENHIGELRPR
ncbi:L-2-hydroxyglutarate oxidase [Microbacterium sp.]|uniref:L-2-hydroxyglutarate oxidase n=1 Tax=Microbacterium sp. TaxID=51671 RepID=UPI003C71349B